MSRSNSRRSSIPHSGRYASNVSGAPSPPLWHTCRRGARDESPDISGSWARPGYISAPPPSLLSHCSRGKCGSKLGHGFRGAVHGWREEGWWADNCVSQGVTGRLGSEPVSTRSGSRKPAQAFGWTLTHTLPLLPDPCSTGASTSAAFAFAAGKLSLCIVHPPDHPNYPSPSGDAHGQSQTDEGNCSRQRRSSSLLATPC